MESNGPDKNEKIFEELEYFFDTSVKSMINGYIPPKQYFGEENSEIKAEERIELIEPYEVFDPFN